MNKPHPQSEFIKAKADGAVVERRLTGIETHFYTMADDDFDFPLGYEYRIKPPAPKWPESTMTGEELHEMYMQDRGSNKESMVVIANAVLAHALETGQVVLP